MDETGLGRMESFWRRLRIAGPLVAGAVRAPESVRPERAGRRTCKDRSWLLLVAAFLVLFGDLGLLVALLFLLPGMGV